MRGERNRDELIKCNGKSVRNPRRRRANVFAISEGKSRDRHTHIQTDKSRIYDEIAQWKRFLVDWGKKIHSFLSHSLFLSFAVLQKPP